MKKMESMRTNLQDIALTKVRTGQEERNYYFQKIKRHSSKGSVSISTWQEHTSLFLSWEALSGSLKCNPCYCRFEEFAEYQTSEQLTLLHFLSPSFFWSPRKTSFQAPAPSQNTIVTHQLCQKMLSTLAGLSFIVVIIQKAKELHRFHSSILSSFLKTLGGQSYK